MTYRIDYNAILSQTTAVSRIEALEREIEKCDYICLTDAIAGMKLGGNLLFEYLGKNEYEAMLSGNVRKYRIRILQDEWGNKPKPGDKIVRTIQKHHRDKAGRKMRINHVNDMRRRGTYKKEFITERVYVIDDKGCIECPFEDAGWFLSEYGVHFESEPRMAICGRKELSGAPCKCPDGTLKHVRYWRYEEAPPWVYDKLPSLKRTRTRTPKPEHTEQPGQPVTTE